MTFLSRNSNQIINFPLPSTKVLLAACDALNELDERLQTLEVFADTKISFLKRAKKEDLISLATDLGENPAPTFSKIDLVSLNQENKHYNEDDAKLMLETVVTEREKRLKMATEQERLKIEAENARKERLKIELELEKLRTTSDGSANPKLEKPSCYQLTKTVPSFDSKNGDITLFLSLFERQAKRAQIDAKDWVSGLLMLMPSDIVQLIARESEENFDNYNYIKSVLLKRYKLSTEEFRKKFFHHQKNSEKSWREFTFEISNYFQEWIERFKIDSF
ncbi:hypothetical protein AVEN_31024-1 [Araneus ventricosus]|uniref:Uncharacterized protein n=1 Tax=Araneus ventricosus TaxID=182803 RepID=A0A4Y2LY13_ARAVE|nr:hypothetical protein AVEN_31024-1 [Araneus ventricosus]